MCMCKLTCVCYGGKFVYKLSGMGKVNELQHNRASARYIKNTNTHNIFFRLWALRLGLAEKQVCVNIRLALEITAVCLGFPAPICHRHLTGATFSFLGDSCLALFSCSCCWQPKQWHKHPHKHSVYFVLRIHKNIWQFTLSCLSLTVLPASAASYTNEIIHFHIRQVRLDSSLAGFEREKLCSVKPWT